MRSKQAIDLSEYLGLSRSTGIVFSLFDSAAGRRLGLFLRASTTSRINAFSNSSSSTLRRNASTVIAAPRHPPRPEDGRTPISPPWAAFWFRGCNAAMPPLRYALTQLCTAPTLTPSCLAACFCCMPPSTSSIAFRLVSRGLWVWPYGQHTGDPSPASVPGTVWSDSQALHHLRGGHRRCEV